MRSSVEGMPSVHPLADGLPAYLQEDSFAVRWTQGLDDVLAPVLSVLDCLDAYLDPGLTPPDFLAWIAGWVGARTDERWDMANQRRSVAAAAGLHGLRGTLIGLAREIEVATGGLVDLDDGADVTISTGPSVDLPEYPDPVLRIRVYVPRPSDVVPSVLERLVVAAKPAHMVHEVEVLPDSLLTSDLPVGMGPDDKSPEVIPPDGAVRSDHSQHGGESP